MRTGSARRLRRLTGWQTVASLGAAVVLVTVGLAGAPASFAAASKTVKPNARGELDCNGYSTVQTSVRSSFVCADLHGANGGRFYDNGWYIGHDEPTIQFLSSAAGSGNDVTWPLTLPTDPTAAPTNNNPAHPVTHTFELTVAPWLSMMMCDPNSYPQTPCTPGSDANASAPNGGAGSAFMEMQFYPPGSAPFLNTISCDNAHWCAALTIDSLEATNNFAYINPGCAEPVNFGFIEADTPANGGNPAPAGPPSPQLANAATFTPDNSTLLMTPGDNLQVHMYDAPVPGGQGNAFRVQIDDVTTGQSGSMQASAANGFMNTNYQTCAGTPFNFQPEFNTAGPANISPWAALQANINTEFEIGHFTPCLSLYRTAGSSGSKEECQGAYEQALGPDHANPEDNPRYVGAQYTAGGNDAFCGTAGQTFAGLGVGGVTSDPITVTGCDNFANGGDLDYDGTPYYPDWPTGTAATASLPSSLVQQNPLSGGASYPQLRVETDLAATEYTCNTAQYPGLAGCTAPPPGPGHFYPYWTQTQAGGGCAFEFGQVPGDTLTTGSSPDSQYGTPSSRYFGNLAGPIQSNPCAG